jgi:hypothetical protein
MGLDFPIRGGWDRIGPALTLDVHSPKLAPNM